MEKKNKCIPDTSRKNKTYVKHTHTHTHTQIVKKWKKNPKCPLTDQ